MDKCSDLSNDEYVVLRSPDYPLVSQSTLESAIDKFTREKAKVLISFSQTAKYPIWLARPLVEVMNIRIKHTPEIPELNLECDTEYMWTIFAYDDNGCVSYGKSGFIINGDSGHFLKDTPSASSYNFILKKYCSIEEMQDISKYIVPEHWFVDPVTSIITDTQKGTPIFGRQDIEPIYVPNRAFRIARQEALESMEDSITKGDFSYYILDYPENLCMKDPLERLQIEEIEEKSLLAQLEATYMTDKNVK